MSDKPILLFLHGVGSGDQEDTWRDALTGALTGLGYPGLDGVTVVAPKYPHALRGVDDNDPLPGLTVKAPTGEAARRNRRDFEHREGAIEVFLGRHDRGTGWVGGDAVVQAALEVPFFVQMKNYRDRPSVRAYVLRRILTRLPSAGRLVIVGHSLGSVIAADLVRRLPPDIEVVGLVTIGSPLANTNLHVEGLRATLKEPPANLGWWVNFWSAADPVTTHRGVSSIFPWMIDCRVHTTHDPQVHDAVRYLANESVAAAIGRALHGSLSKELAPVDTGVDIPLDYAETLALMALRFAYLTQTKLKDRDVQERYADALRQVQARTADLVRERNAREGRPMPAAVAGLALDLSDPRSVAAEPSRIHHLSKDEAVVPLTSIAAANVIRPVEITVPPEARREALEDLTVEMGLGRQFGIDVFTAAEDARKALAGSDTHWVRWVALSIGAAALVAATGGLALAAAPGVAGAAAITSALAAFGPGGMIGGLLTAGALATAGGGGIAVGLANAATSAETVEAIVSTQLTAAIVRKRQGLEQDPTTVRNLLATGIELRRERARLEPLSDESAPTLKELKRKLETIDRALACLSQEGLQPADAGADDGIDAARGRGADFFDRATEVFRPVDLDGDGIPDKPRALTAAEDAGTAVKGAVTGAADAFGSLFRRRRADGASTDDADSGSAGEGEQE
ncbi:hypothetical protein [Raineyella sp.]|uniref:hypothetical protein n=1 Tax=Raineyella sp. TaxID=1911550 RepID=UPI002B1EE559|nr:hypothetical protein [Raineyella sp.]MEA5153487.1 hypothetical protein [Raineyella sp.]